MKTLRQIGEHAAIEALTANLSAVGDDCAVLPLDEHFDLVLTSDPLIQTIHFSADATAEQIGHKAVCRVLSDFAAMGADPQYLLVNVVAPPEQDVRTLEAIYAEFSRLRIKYGAEVVGGDLAEGPLLELHVFGAGRVPKGCALLRSRAEPGDPVYVTGPLGCAQKSGRQFTFEPRLDWGRALRESGAVTAMMDISDGLATDLRHILKASGVGAEIVSSQIPTVGRLDQALYDGEDFELLFTVRGCEADRFEGYCLKHLGRRFSKIGTVTARRGELLLDGLPLAGKAFEHFGLRDEAQ